VLFSVNILNPRRPSSLVFRAYTTCTFNAQLQSFRDEPLANCFPSHSNLNLLWDVIAEWSRFSDARSKESNPYSLLPIHDFSGLSKSNQRTHKSNRATLMRPQTHGLDCDRAWPRMRPNLKRFHSDSQLRRNTPLLDSNCSQTIIGQDGCSSHLYKLGRTKFAMQILEFGNTLNLNEFAKKMILHLFLSAKRPCVFSMIDDGVHVQA